MLLSLLLQLLENNKRIYSQRYSRHTVYTVVRTIRYDESPFLFLHQTFVKTLISIFFYDQNCNFELFFLC